jgi:hypothetical protein
MYINGEHDSPMGNVLHLEQGLSNGLSLETFSFFVLIVFNSHFSAMRLVVRIDLICKSQSFTSHFLIYSTLFLLTLVLLRV